MAEKYKYGSPEDVAQRILEWLGQNARQDATSLLLYEAMQALKKGAASPADQGEDPRDDYAGCCDTPTYCSAARRCTAKDAR